MFNLAIGKKKSYNGRYVKKLENMRELWQYRLSLKCLKARWTFCFI